MNANSQAIIIFCSSLCTTYNAEPLSTAKWNELAQKLLKHKLQPKDILNFSVHDFRTELELDEDYSCRLIRLIDRSHLLFSELWRYESQGIRICTRADLEYPVNLKRKLGLKCPPIFYFAGDIRILTHKFIGYAGSRNINDDDVNFTRITVKKTCEHNFCVVSGGARGTDYIAAQSSLSEGIPAAEYVSGNLSALLKKRDVMKSISEGKRLILSENIPEAKFHVWDATNRNKYIYAQSDSAIIIRSDTKGGTWSGANENLNHKWCTLFCRDIDYPGNKELIRLGAIPINQEWDIYTKTLGRKIESHRQKEFDFRE